MNTVPEYVVPLIQAQNAGANILGVQIMLVDPQTYRVNLTVLTLLGVMMKALNDHGVVLDAEWQTRINGALAGTWPDWLINQIDPTKPVPPS